MHVHLKEGLNTMATKKATKKPVVVKSNVASSALDGFTSKLKERAFVGSLVVEILGTFLLTSAFIIRQGDPIVLLFGLGAIVMILGTKAGVHLNPAITLAAWVTKNITGFRAVMFVLGQFLGAVLAFAVLKFFVDAADASSAQAMYYGAPSLYKLPAIPADKQWYVFLAEVIGTFVLAYGVSGVLRAKKDKLVAGVTLGFAIFLGVLISSTVAGYVTGAVVLNPAIASVLSVDFNSQWTYVVYLLAPVVGALLGFVVNKAVSTDN
jgi:aquaporin Z